MKTQLILHEVPSKRCPFFSLETVTFHRTLYGNFLGRMLHYLKRFQILNQLSLEQNRIRFILVLKTILIQAGMSLKWNSFHLLIKPCSCQCWKYLSLWKNAILVRLLLVICPLVGKVCQSFYPLQIVYHSAKSP